MTQDTASLFNIAEHWSREFEKGVPPESMKELRGHVARLMSFVESPPQDLDCYQDLTNLCRQFLNAESALAAKVNSRQPQPDVAPEIQYTLSLGPINIDSVSGLKPDFNIPMTPITVGMNDSYGPKRLILRDQYGKERYFSLRHSFVFEYDEANIGFSVAHNDHTLIIEIKGGEQPSLASVNR